MLLAVDLGVRCGLALYGRDGRLVWYRSRNFGSTARLRRGAQAVLREHPDVTQLVLEGPRNLAEIWARAAEQSGLPVRLISAETWREAILHPREQRGSAVAKLNADRLARRVIAWSGARAPTSLRHDAAEAIMVGLWGVMDAGWLAPPGPLGR